jgi:hypothetical protein
MRKDGLHDPVEAVLAVHEFRQAFGAYLVARTSGGRAYLPRELEQEKSVIGAFLRGSKTRARLRTQDLKDAEEYLSH